MSGAKLNLGIWTLMALMMSAPAAQAAVAVLEQVTGRPAIYAVGDAGARQVSLARQGAEYVLPIEIETGPADTAGFRLPDGDVAIAPNTLMRIAAPVPRGADQGLMQRILQRAGSALFSVDRREAEHFEVETPYLVSVVKGTTFTVLVHEQGATVSLHEGRLHVADRDGGRVELLPGDVAFSGSDGEVQKLVGTLTRQATADEIPSRAGARSRAGLASATTPPGDGATSRGDQLPQGAELADVAGDAQLQPLADDAGVALEDLAEGLDTDLSLADLGGPGDLIGSAALDGGDLSGDFGLADDLDLGGGADLAADLGDDIGLSGDLVDTAGGLVDGLDDAAGDLIADLGGDLGDVVGDLGDTAGDLVGGVGGTAGDLVSDLGGGAGDLVGDLGGAAGDLVGTVNEDLGDLSDGLVNTGGDLVGDLGDTTGQLVGDTTSAAGDLVDAAGDTAGGLVGGLTDTTGNLVGDITDPDGNVVGDVADAGGGLLNDVTDTTGGLVDGVGDAGGDVVSGVVATGGDLTDGLTEAAGGVVGNLGGLLGRLRL